jgi:hypothetical protein
MAINIYTYNRLNKNLDLFNIPEIISYIPTPQSNDYERGFIKRYFIQKSNDENSYVYEVSADTYSDFNANPFYKAQYLKWRLSGTSEEVSQSNYKAVKLASHKIKGLLLYLPNYLQFYKY